MANFENVTVIKEASIYFDGKVTSRTVLFADGSKKTLGIILPGEYEFGTAAKEVMDIISGGLEIQLAGETGWIKVEAGASFEVPANSSFRIKAASITDYCCSYIT